MLKRDLYKADGDSLDILLEEILATLELENVHKVKKVVAIVRSTRMINAAEEQALEMSGPVVLKAGRRLAV